MLTFARVRQLIAALLLAWYLPACSARTHWRTQPVVPQETKHTKYAGDVRVTTTDGTTHAFRGVWVSADSLGGWLIEPAGRERAFALASVESLKVRRHAQTETQRDPGMSSAPKVTTAVLLAGVILVTLVAGTLGSFHSLGGH